MSNANTWGATYFNPKVPAVTSDSASDVLKVGCVWALNRNKEINKSLACIFFFIRYRTFLFTPHLLPVAVPFICCPAVCCSCHRRQTAHNRHATAENLKAETSRMQAVQSAIRRALLLVRITNNAV